MEKNKIKQAIEFIHRIEDGILIILFVSIIIFALSQIILRNFFDGGLVWAESLLRVLVLWLGLFGAILAVRNSRQLNIDVISKYLNVKQKAYTSIINNIFAAIVCLIISYYSVTFLKLEYDASSYAFEKIPFWITASVIPLSFLIMSIRYSLKSYTEIKQINS